MILHNPKRGGHISEQFDNDLLRVTSHLMEMGGLVEKQVANAIDTLISGNKDAAYELVERDKIINQMETAIDEECINIIARRQPAASDLRLVISISKAVSDLERIADEAKRIARMAISLGSEGVASQGLIEIRHIGHMVNLLVHDTLDAFARLDVDAALSVAQRDNAVDIEYSTAIREMITYMMEDPRVISRSMNIIWSLRSLERIGDHARNIAEYTIYIVSGRQLRHSSIDSMQEELKKEE